MRAVIQRVLSARVAVSGEVVGAIDAGLAVLVGISPTDTSAEAVALAAKLAGLRIFRDGEGKMNLSVGDISGGILVISQFTLYGDVRKGRRPSFVGAASPEMAEPLVNELVVALQAHGLATATGTFGAEMKVSLINDGPVTLVLEVADGRVR